MTGNLTRLTLAALCITFLAACGAAASPSPAPTASTHTVTGALTIEDGSAHDSTSCWGSGGFEDITEGTDILVVDGAGATVGKAELSVGEWTVEAQQLGGGKCVFTFTAQDVADVPFYSVRIGDRDGPTWTNAEMIAQNWDVGLTLGD